MKNIKKAGLFVGILIASIGQAFCQTNLVFTEVNATDEGNIRMTWSSVSNEVYEIDAADSLIDTNTGSITWNLLYNNYPSQGTNTFWLDTGNYNLSPQILNPKDMPMRFYRIVDLGPDTTPDEPTVSIVSPTNNALAASELTIIVTATTDQPVLDGTKLYVDGQEMGMADGITNFTDSTGVTNYEVDTYSINTCEWGNGAHILFATTQCESGHGDAIGAPPVTTGHGVSPFVAVTFNNLVTEISFSEPSFDPSSGQTQQVSAVFPLNSDWTLSIVDVNSNVVQTATGSGMSMLYNWDGTDNGTNLPNGIYYYYITAATNGLASNLVSEGSGGGSGGGSLLSPDAMRSSFGGAEASELWAVPTNDVADAMPLPFALYPPGFDTNSLTIFAATTSDIASLRPAVPHGTSLSVRAMDGGGGASPDAIGDPGYITPLGDPQSIPPAPQRPPNNPVKGLAGTFGIAYDTYSADGTNGFLVAPVDNGLGIGEYISMQGFSGTDHLRYLPLPQYTDGANNFISQMQHWGWKSLIREADNQLTIGGLTGIDTPFNRVNVGAIMCHGTYGNQIDYGSDYYVKDIYFPVTSGGGAEYLRMTDMDLGGAGTNGLRWFAIMACDSLQQTDWASMQSEDATPCNSNLHLILGTDSTNYANPYILSNWAKYMNFGTSTNYSPLTVQAAWYQAGIEAFRHYTFPTPVKFAASGDAACKNDTLQSYSTPGGSSFYVSQTVWPPPPE